VTDPLNSAAQKLAEDYGRNQNLPSRVNLEFRNLGRNLGTSGTGTGKSVYESIAADAHIAIREVDGVLKAPLFDSDPVRVEDRREEGNDGLGAESILRELERLCRPAGVIGI